KLFARKVEPANGMVHMLNGNYLSRREDLLPVEDNLPFSAGRLDFNFRLRLDVIDEEFEIKTVDLFCGGLSTDLAVVRPDWKRDLRSYVLGSRVLEQIGYAHDV